MRSKNNLAIMLSFAFLPFLMGSNDIVLNSLVTKAISGEVHYTNHAICYPKIDSSQLKDCTITIKNEDGTTLEVTFHDITWIQCAKIKIGKWIKDTF